MKNPTSSSRRGERRRRNEVRARRSVRLLTGSGWLPDQARKCADHMKSCSWFDVLQSPAHRWADASRETV